MSEQDTITPKPAMATASPHEHAKALGAFRVREVRKGEIAVTSINGQAVDMGIYSWQHNAAAALHGWYEHEHHEAKPIDLSLDDYKKALLAASTPVVRVVSDVNAKVKGAAVGAKAGEALDMRKLGITTEDLANAGVAFVADYEPYKPALSKHAAFAKKAADQTETIELFAKA